MLKGIPYKGVCGDLTAVFSIVLGQREYGQMTAKVTNRHMELWGTDMDALWRLAEENTPKLYPVKWIRLQDILTEMMEGLLVSEHPLEDGQGEAMSSPMEISGKESPGKETPGAGRENPAGLMYVLTNTVNIRGAAAILYPGVLKEIAGQLGGDFIIFPSSIHEAILAKAKGFFDWEAAEATVREINLKEVEPEDILSDTVYYYHQAKDCIMVAREMGDGTGSILW